MSSVHEEKRSFKCNMCDASFGQNNHLKVHRDSVHKGKKLFKCNICDANFKFRIVFWNIFFKVWRFEKQIALSERKPPLAMTLNLPLLYVFLLEEYCQISPNKNRSPNL